MGAFSGSQGSCRIWEEMHHTRPKRPSGLLHWEADGVCSLQARACREAKPRADVSHPAPLTAASRRRKLPNTIALAERRGHRRQDEALAASIYFPQKSYNQRGDILYTSLDTIWLINRRGRNSNSHKKKTQGAEWNKTGRIYTCAKR